MFPRMMRRKALVGNNTGRSDTPRGLACRSGMAQKVRPAVGLSVAYLDHERALVSYIRCPKHRFHASGTIHSTYRRAGRQNLARAEISVRDRLSLSRNAFKTSGASSLPNDSNTSRIHRSATNPAAAFSPWQPCRDVEPQVCRAPPRLHPHSKRCCGLGRCTKYRAQSR